MNEKKSFILKMPNFLATKAASIYPRFFFASCYIALLAGLFVPIYGSVCATVYCLVVWQVFKLKSKKQTYYKIYVNFLMQRIVLSALASCLVFYLSYSQIDGFNMRIWSTLYFTLGILLLSDAIFSLKGLIGMGFINGKYNK